MPCHNLATTPHLVSLMATRKKTYIKQACECCAADIMHMTYVNACSIAMNKRGNLAIIRLSEKYKGDHMSKITDGRNERNKGQCDY